MKLRSILDLKDEELKGRRVLLRVDFNVPLGRGERLGSEEDWRIIRTLPTVEHLRARGARILICSHLGRPQGAVKKELRLDAVAHRFSRLLKASVKKIDSAVGKKAQEAAAKLKDGEILILENLRFYPGEERNEEKFARELAALADIFINDAFGVAHHPSASTVAITEFLPSYAGLLMLSEVAALSKALFEPKRPCVVLIGGSKVSDKIGVISNLLKKTQALLLGGALVNAFLAAAGFKIGASKSAKEEVLLAKKIGKAKKLHLPQDVVVGFPGNLRLHGRVVSLAGLDKKRDLCGKNEAVLDIGPRTVAAYAGWIKKAKTIIWNGPVGMFEAPQFKYGTMGLARLIAARSSGRAFGVVGGGETVQALNQSGMAEYVDHISTGGGAMLEFLEGKILPGIKPLVKEARR